MSKATNGKGDSPRNCFSQKFRDNYDAIFKDEERPNTRTGKKGRRFRSKDRRAKKMVARIQYR